MAVIGNLVNLKLTKMMSATHKKFGVLVFKLKNLLKNAVQFLFGSSFYNRPTKEKETAYKFERTELPRSVSGEFNKRRLINLINYGKTTFSSDFSFEGGYQTVKLSDEILEGRRSPEIRISDINLNFKDKVVLDIGCNQGAILFHLAEQIKFGFGVDYEEKMINCCNALKRYNDNQNLDFFYFDLDNDPHELLLDLCPFPQIDVVFLMAVCQHIQSWRSLISFIAQNSKVLVLETNGTDEQQACQIRSVKENFKKVNIIYQKSRDDFAQRTLLIAQNHVS